MGPLLLLSQLSAQFHAVMVLDDYALDFGVSGCLIDFGVSGCLVAALPLSCVQSRLFEGSSLGLSSLYGMCHFEGPPLPPSLSAKLATLLHRYCRLRQGFQPKPLSPPPPKKHFCPAPAGSIRSFRLNPCPLRPPSPQPQYSPGGSNDVPRVLFADPDGTVGRSPERQLA